MDDKSKNKQIIDILVSKLYYNQGWHMQSNYFNSFFSTVVSKLLDKNIPPQQMQEIPDIPFNTESMFLIPTSEQKL